MSKKKKHRKTGAGEQGSPPESPPDFASSLGMDDSADLTTAPTEGSAEHEHELEEFSAGRAEAHDDEPGSERAGDLHPAPPESAHEMSAPEPGENTDVAIARMATGISVFASVAAYLRDVAWSIRSVAGACATSVPYLFSAGEYRKEVTEQYPDPISSKTADDLPPRSRGILFNDIERCTGCRECESVCPVKCIHVENEPGPDVNKVWVSVFNIDFAQCTFCGLCVETCAPQSLFHTKQYEGSVYSKEDLVAGFGRGHVTPEQRDKWAQVRSLSDDGDSDSFQGRDLT